MARVAVPELVFGFQIPRLSKPRLSACNLTNGAHMQIGRKGDLQARTCSEKTPSAVEEGKQIAVYKIS